MRWPSCTAWLIGVVILGVDAFSKFLTQHYLPLVKSHHVWYPYGGVGVFKDFLGVEFSINHVINKGAAWGVFYHYQDQLLYFRICLIAAMLVYILFYNTKQANTIPLIMICAGALGNVLDYYLYGHVVDMLHFVLWGYDFPVFNLADCAIFLGISWLFVGSYLSPPVKKTTAKRA